MGNSRIKPVGQSPSLSQRLLDFPRFSRLAGGRSGSVVPTIVLRGLLTGVGGPHVCVCVCMCVCVCTCRDNLNTSLEATSVRGTHVTVLPAAELDPVASLTVRIQRPVGAVECAHLDNFCAELACVLVQRALGKHRVPERKRLAHSWVEGRVGKSPWAKQEHVRLVTPGTGKVVHEKADARMRLQLRVQRGDRLWMEHHVGVREQHKVRVAPEWAGMVQAHEMATVFTPPPSLFPQPWMHDRAVAKRIGLGNLLKLRNRNAGIVIEEHEPAGGEQWVVFHRCKQTRLLGILEDVSEAMVEEDAGPFLVEAHHYWDDLFY